MHHNTNYAIFPVRCPVWPLQTNAVAEDTLFGRRRLPTLDDRHLVRLTGVVLLQSVVGSLQSLFGSDFEEGFFLVHLFTPWVNGSVVRAVTVW